MAEVVQKISNYKQNMLLVNCNRISYLLVNVGRKRLDLQWRSQGRVPEVPELPWGYETGFI